jgi:large subunit ribosomal protein L30
MAASPKATLRITQRRSPSGTLPNQRHTLRTLGLRGIGRTVERPDSPELRGMIRTVEHLVEVSSAEGAGASKAAADA